MIVTDKEFKSLKKVIVDQYEEYLKAIGPEIGWTKQDYRMLGTHEGKLQLLAWINDYFTQALHAKIDPNTGEVLEMKRGHDGTNTNKSTNGGSGDRKEKCSENT